MSMQQTDEYWIDQALGLACRAQSQDEVPVGAVLVRDGLALGTGWNQTITLNDPSAHAEIIALRAAGQAASNYRLPDTTLYVTLEPCPMCVGAMIHARIARLVVGAPDPKIGAAGSVFDLLRSEQHNHHIEFSSGVRETECSELLKRFFRARR